MRKFINGYYRLLNVLLGVSVGVLLLPVTIQMFSRFTQLIPAWIWTEEMARFLFIWMVMLGAMIGVRDASHFDVDVWPQLKPRPDALLRLVSMVFVLVFALVFVWYGIKFVQFGWNQTSELADMPMPWIFVAWPLTGFTWLVFGLERMREDLRILIDGPGQGPGLAERTREIGTGSVV
jgi:TRAP-type C4-dicarboxylate transport system permease small subunit